MFKIGPWKRHNIYTTIRESIAQTGLHDFGGDKTTFIERYAVARTLGLERSKAKFSPIGIPIVNLVVRKRIKMRLLLVDYFKKHPHVESIPVKSPIFIIGFPRTGTTFLHELLGLHPDVKVHYSWEQVEPVPRTDSESLIDLTNDRKLRYKTNKTFFDTALLLAGSDIQSIHRIGYDEPEECTIPCAVEIPWAISEIPLYIFAAKEVIALKGAGDAFVFYKKYLQLLTWQSADRRDKDFTWMLKCPFHLPYLDELYQSFPDATVVWTHRDPVECIGSACSLYETLMRMSMEEADIDRVALGKAVLDYTRLSLDMAMDSLKRLEGKVKVVHVRYADNVKNPKGTCKDICERAGLPFNEEYVNRVDKYLAKNAEGREKLKAKKGTGKVLHSYKPEDYGLSTEGIRTTFNDYITKYNLSEKK
eukprot:gene16957-22449_t